MINLPLDAAQQARCEQLVAAAEWVEDDARLAELCHQWRQQPLVALDTEFIRTDTFYPQPGLIQVGVADGVYLIDPLAIADMQPLVALFDDPAVLKLLHAGSEDLELFASQYGTVPRPLFDTQIACAFVGMGLSIGYQRLLETFFGLSVDKQETRSDWLQRPLTESQCRYAALDVVYLGEIYRRLKQRLAEQGSYDWVVAECAQIAADALLEPDPQLYYLRFKQAWKMRPRQLAILQTLAAWREGEARQRNIPRNFVLHNNSLLDMAYKAPGSLRELSQITQIRGRTLSKDGQTLLDLVTAATSKSEMPPVPDAPLPSTLGKKIKSLKQLIQQMADQWHIAPELLVRKKDLEALVRSGLEGGSYQLPTGLCGWREAIIGQPLLQQLQQH
ncbi:MAG TPA: ribonuclease D [Motiliproteus sp.]